MKQPKVELEIHEGKMDKSQFFYPNTKIRKRCQICKKLATQQLKIWDTDETKPIKVQFLCKRHYDQQYKLIMSQAHKVKENNP